RASASPAPKRADSPRSRTFGLSPRTSEGCVMNSLVTRCGLLTLAAVLLQGAASAQQASPAVASAWVAIPGMEALPVLQRAQDVGAAAPDQVLDIAVSLPYARPAEAQAFVDDVSNPASPHYRRFISPAEVGAAFGVPLASVSRIVQHLRAA